MQGFNMTYASYQQNNMFINSDFIKSESPCSSKEWDREGRLMKEHGAL